MIDKTLVQYAGFEARPLVRVYTFVVREGEQEPREFTLSITNEAFDSHRARYQDAPDICSAKLRHELAACASQPVKTHFRITDAELDDYRGAHKLKPAWNPYKRKPEHDF